MMHYRRFEDSSWVIADLLPVFEATIPKTHGHSNFGVLTNIFLCDRYTKNCAGVEKLFQFLINGLIYCFHTFSNFI